jgi:hypothetical protein
MHTLFACTLLVVDFSVQPGIQIVKIRMGVGALKGIEPAFINIVDVFSRKIIS